MSEPKRLREVGSDDVRALLAAGERTRPITPIERARTGRRLARYASASAVAVGLAWAPSAALGAGLGVAAIVVGWGVPKLLEPPPPPDRSDPASVVAPRASRAVATTSATAQAPPLALAPSVPTPPPAMAATRAASSAAPIDEQPPSSPDALAEEVALLDRARAALVTNPAEALQLTEAHGARFPTGQLRMERELLVVDALRKLGRTAEARDRAATLLLRAKGSLYEERVRRLLDAMK